MTSDVDVGPVLRRRFHLHCVCGATVVTSHIPAACPDCGQRVTFHRRRWFGHHWDSQLRPVAQELFFYFGAVIFFLLAWHLFNFAFAVFLATLVALVASIRGSRSDHHSRQAAASDSGSRFRWAGRLFFLLTAFFIFGYAIPGANYREQVAFLAAHKPPYCDWAWSPMGDKHCHYESSFTHDAAGRVTVEWHRVED